MQIYIPLVSCVSVKNGAYKINLTRSTENIQWSENPEDSCLDIVGSKEIADYMQEWKTHKNRSSLKPSESENRWLFYDARHYWPVVQQVKHLLTECKNTLLICSIATPYASKESDVTQRNIAKLLASYPELYPCAETLWVGLHIATSWKQGGWDPVFISPSLMETEIPLQSFHQNYWGKLIWETFCNEAWSDDTKIWEIIFITKEWTVRYLHCRYIYTMLVSKFCISCRKNWPHDSRMGAHSLRTPTFVCGA